MAQLHDVPYDFARTPGLDFMGRLREEESELARLIQQSDALGGEGLIGAVVSFPVADGSATYLVKSEAPLTLQHVPFFDGYRIDSAMLRGLGAEDVRRRVYSSRRLRKLIASRA